MNDHKINKQRVFFFSLLRFEVGNGIVYYIALTTASQFFVA